MPGKFYWVIDSLTRQNIVHVNSKYEIDYCFDILDFMNNFNMIPNKWNCFLIIKLELKALASYT